MRIALLTKRRYMRHDVIKDRYGRLYALPSNLALLGHDVLGICLSYHPIDEGHWQHEAAPGRLRWTSSNAGRLLLPGILNHVLHVQRLLTAFQPDVIVGASDALHVALAGFIGKRLGLPRAIDLYDNFESFGLTRVPFLRGIYRRTLRQADVVTCVSAQLSARMREEYAASGVVETLESTIGGRDFVPRDRRYCRSELGLPQEAKLIGTAGALDRSRGIGDLLEAFNALSRRDHRLHLVLAGTLGRRTRLPKGPRVHYIGQLPHDRVPLVYGAFDIGVIPLRDSPFGRYSFPQKTYEMVAMRIPLVVAAVGAMKHLFASHPDCLYSPGSPGDLADKIARQLAAPVVPDLAIPTWAEQARRLERLLLAAARHRATALSQSTGE